VVEKDLSLFVVSFIYKIHREINLQNFGAMSGEGKFSFKPLCLSLVIYFALDERSFPPKTKKGIGKVPFNTNPKAFFQSR